MTNITIPNLDKEVKRRLHVRAAEHGRSIIRAQFEPLSRVEVDIHQRKLMRKPPAFNRA